MVVGLRVLGQPVVDERGGGSRGDGGGGGGGNGRDGRGGALGDGHGLGRMGVVGAGGGGSAAGSVVGAGSARVSVMKKEERKTGRRPIVGVKRLKTFRKVGPKERWTQ